MTNDQKPTAEDEIREEERARIVAYWTPDTCANEINHRGEAMIDPAVVTLAKRHKLKHWDGTEREWCDGCLMSRAILAEHERRVAIGLGIGLDVWVRGEHQRCAEEDAA
jgi:hypothetical protein